MRRTHSKNSLFLMELIVNILFFSILIVVALQLFMKAHNLSKNTTELQRAVTSVENAVNLYASCNESYSTMMQRYPNYSYLDSEIILYLDSDFLACSENDYKYYVSIQPVSERFDHQTEPGQLAKTQINCYTRENVLLYGISSLSYEPLTPDKLSGGDAND